ncbi:histone deacetylase superfamily [Xylanimonas cellulosilytica DSM 15894]|uniref:Acetoin utilization protein AcuC n=1 Tax=Xylanimonas cellulosilytica (strain DSM 15894 / JCM 12276 / CECT 5975 / KCTC 9989 / LMG 20990 / NBRC 107835 / XIL07) TaxID=446471 RepID=D1BVW6_XYLCX|nr:acetoin utilization protein AcuC [Xylanimonas cellulosilytica]ACZ29469.1 histone deacetylase superfamily [Xylanimonas cellulosilytica DSM 15894]
MPLARLVWSPELLQYDFGRGHPMSPARLDLTMRLADELGLLTSRDLEVVAVPPASDAVLETVHDAAYVAAVRAADAGRPAPERGLGTEDDPVFAGMHDAAARLVAGSVDVADAVWDGRVLHGLNVAGGMHHAHRDAASGFCIYNDAAAAVQRLLDAGAQRVAYVDLDAHHGDGVEAQFWDDPRVLTVSIHQDGSTLFPGTGSPADVGGAGAEGSVVNLALPPRTGSEGWLRALDAVVPALLREFRPQVIVSQHGADAHAKDPLSDLRVGIDALRQAARVLHDLSHELADGRWVALGGGGYAVVDVVPLVWSSLVAEALHAPLDLAQPLPPAWREHVAQASGLTAARYLGIETAEWRRWAAGYDPADDVDRAVLATRKHVFPLWGLDPYQD